MEKVSRYVEQQAEPVSRNSVERNVTGAVEYLRAAMDALTLDGYLAESKGRPQRTHAEQPEALPRTHLV